MPGREAGQGATPPGQGAGDFSPVAPRESRLGDSTFHLLRHSPLSYSRDDLHGFHIEGIARYACHEFTQRFVDRATAPATALTQLRRTPRSRPSRRLLPVMMALLAATAGCEPAKGTKQGAPPPPVVVVAEVVQRTVPIIRDFTARTEAVPTVEVRARVAGMLERVLFKEGTEVRQGQTLFVIQQDEYNAALESARAQLAKAEADLTRARDASIVDRARAVLDQRKADLGKARQDVARYRPLAAARAIPQQDLDTSVAAEKVAAAGVEAAEAALRDTQLAQRTQIQLAEAAVLSAKAGVTQAELNLSYTTIRAPIGGIIGKIQVDPGNLVGKSEPTLLATVSTVDPIYADFNVAEVDYLRLAPQIRLDPQGRAQDTGRRLELFLADNSLFPHKGRVVFVDRAVDPKTGTIGVQAQFPNPGRVLRPGQFARVRAVVEERPDAVLVPQLAVQEQQGAKIVLVVEAGDKVALRPVTLDERLQDLYIVKSGLKPGERVIVEGLQKARPGMQVKPELRPAAEAAPAPDTARPPAAGSPGHAPAPPPAGKPKGGG
jgi:membrane fusion protein (multidrug efflux system)